MNDCPALVVKLTTPKVLWYQTDVSVVLRIMLPDVEDYFLLIDRDHLRFSTIVNDRKYYLCLYLFGAVIPEKCKHSNLGREIKVDIPKGHKWTQWLRLGIDNTKNPQITKDLDRIQKNEIKMKQYLPAGALVQYKTQWQIPVTPVVPSSEEDTCSETSDKFIDEDW